MQLAKRLLGKRLTSETSDLCLEQIACYATGLLVLVLGFRKLGVLELTQVELFFGVLLVLCLSLLCLVTGHLARLLRLFLKTTGNSGPANTARDGGSLPSLKP